MPDYSNRFLGNEAYDLEDLEGCPQDALPERHSPAELYTLNVIYGQGGKFVTHKDTPRSADALGTSLFAYAPLQARARARARARP
jgi:hypothetical protein